METLRNEKLNGFGARSGDAFPINGRDRLVDEILREMFECKFNGETIDTDADWDLSLFEDRDDYRKIGRFAKFMKDWIEEPEC